MLAQPGPLALWLAASCLRHFLPPCWHFCCFPGVCFDPKWPAFTPSSLSLFLIVSSCFLPSLKLLTAHLLSAPFPSPGCLMRPAPLSSSSQERKPNCPSCHDIYSVSAMLYVLCKDILRMKNEYMIQCLRRGLRGPLLVVAVPPTGAWTDGLPTERPWLDTHHYICTDESPVSTSVIENPFIHFAYMGGNPGRPLPG